MKRTFRKSVFSMGQRLWVCRLIAALTLITAASSAQAADPPPTHADVSYGPHPHQLLDVYLLPQGDAPHPVVIWYGGLWKPAKYTAQLKLFQSQNIALVAVQLRTMTDAVEDKVSPPVSYVMQDACRAVQFVKMHAPEWNLRPDRIAVGGGSQGALPALYVGCAGDKANPRSADPVERISTQVACVAAYRSQPTIDPQRMQDWVPGVKWGAPALGCSFEESLQRREELLPVIRAWSPDWLLHPGAAPIYFENNWGLTQPEGIGEMDYKVHAPQWGLGFQKLAEQAGVICLVKYPDHPTEKYKGIWDFIVQQLQAP
jgi:acetyl esterase/lipase